MEYMGKAVKKAEKDMKKAVEDKEKAVKKAEKAVEDKEKAERKYSEVKHKLWLQGENLLNICAVRVVLLWDDQ